MSIPVIRYHVGFGRQSAETVRYDLPTTKTAFAERIMKAITEHREGFVIHDLVRLDAGTLPESKLLELFTPEERATAVARRREKLTAELRDLDRLEELVPRVDAEAIVSGKRRRVRDNADPGQDGHDAALGGDEATRRAR